MLMIVFSLLSSTRLLYTLISALSREFAMTDLGTLYHFLGTMVMRDNNGPFLSQPSYTSEIIDRASTSSCKRCSKPVDISVKHRVDATDLLSDESLYYALVEAL